MDSWCPHLCIYIVAEYQGESERVRVAVRLRPKNAEDLADADYAECVELQPELKRLKLRKNNWSSESYRFDEVFTESASQKRVYEAVAKPVVESVLDGYNGTVMAYGQTGTGKTYTLGRLGKEDASERGIMVRAFEDILAGISASDSVEVSYLQLYMESIQDLLAPEKINIPIVEDAKTGEVSVPGVERVKIRNLDHFLQLVQLGEVNRHAANTKMNTESSRSHAILMVYIRRSPHEKEETDIGQQEEIPTGQRPNSSNLGKHKSLAENSPHIPTRDSKLTRLLRDSFGGSARTSLIITIGPSSRHHAETASTVMFGQRAMKVVNMVKLKEEFDYESLCRKLETQIDHLSAEVDRQQKLRDNDKNEMKKLLENFENSSVEAEKRFVVRSELLQKENAQLTSDMKKLLQELDSQKEQNKLLLDEIERLVTSAENSKFLEEENTRLELELNDVKKDMKRLKDQNNFMHDELARLEMNLKHNKEENSRYHEALADTTNMYEERIEALNQQLKVEIAHINTDKEIDELQTRLEEMHQLQETTANELQILSIDYKNLESEKETLKNELYAVRQTLQVEERRRKEAETELKNIMKAVPESEDGFEEKTSYMHENTTNVSLALRDPQASHKYSRSRETILSQRNTITKICEEGKILAFLASFGLGHSSYLFVMYMILSIPYSLSLLFYHTVGLQKILSLLESGDIDVQIHAVKVVANLAAEDTNQERIVQEGGLDALLMLVESSENTTILRVASGAIANLAMNEINQCLITDKGGAKLLANVSSKTDDPQTLRMVAGAIANLCGNEKLHVFLKEDGAIKALLGMTRSGNTDVIAQVARGLANFAKCESRRIVQEDNARDFITSGGLKELIGISDESARDDIRNLAKKTIRLSPLFRGELHAER
ncbi:hypothetical protein DH2020_010589 [Rehmannia glutinosa]|uniref:Kinesin motor domain-containing protein n=1 Tax=Rehmannia glutinosa TaxID=99300 RepID=A0ABR0XB40_REHGL